MKTQHVVLILLLGFSKNLLAQSIQVNSTTPAATYCQGTEITLSLTEAAAGTKYKWQSDNIKIEDDVAEMPKLVLDEVGTVEIKLTINGSTTITPIKFTVNPKPKISEIKSMIQGSTITLVSFDSFSSGTVTYTWTHPDGATTSANPLVIGTAPITKQGQYQLVVKNIATGCMNTYKHKVPEEEKKASAPEPVFGTPVSEEEEVTYNYIIRRHIPVKECTIDGDIINANLSLPPRKSRFTLTEQKEDYSIVKFWDWRERKWFSTDKKARIQNLNAKYNGTFDNPKFFRVANDRLGQGKQAIPHHSIWFLNSLSFTAGTLVVPVKLRRTFETDKKFDFSKDFSLGGFIGLRTRISHYKPHYLNLGVSLGITAVTITPQNANPDKVKEAKDLAAFSHAFGAILEFERVQVAILRGRDLLSHYTQNQTGWIHNNTTWFGVGFGYAILSRPDKIVSSKGNNNDAK